jgi:thioredoxin 1
MSPTDFALSNHTLVVCLCAQWCGSCRDYTARFEQVGHQLAGTRFVWVDIEDEADLVDPVEVENFPTLLIVRDGAAVFFGPLTPHAETLERLVLSCLPPAMPAPVADAEVQALVARLLASNRLAAA